MRSDQQKPRHPTYCPICHAQNDSINTGVRIADGFINNCKKCSGYFLFPPRIVEYTGSGWTSFREAQWEEDVQLAKKLAPRIIEHIENYLGRPVKRILEIGCGSGFMGIGFKHAGCEYVGIDVDAKSIESAKCKGINAHCIGLEEAKSHAAIDQSFDLIISANVFEHFTDPSREFVNLTSIMHDGIIVIIVPNAMGMFAMLKSNKALSRIIQCVLGNDGKIAYSIDGYWHNISYSQKTLCHLCEMTGIDVIKVEPIGNNDPLFGFVQPNTALLYRFRHLSRHDWRFRSRGAIGSAPRKRFPSESSFPAGHRRCTEDSGQRREPPRISVLYSCFSGSAHRLGPFVARLASSAPAKGRVGKVANPLGRLTQSLPTAPRPR